MKQLLLFAAFCTLALGQAQLVALTGTGDPDVDVPAVQAAVDQGGSVVLVGHFSFDRSPTTPAGQLITAWSRCQQTS
jgi:hypothetical protein